MTVIAMTREMGTRGREVAALVAERLGSRLVYHELVSDPPDPADLTGPSEVKRHLGNGSGAPAGANGATRHNGRMTELELLELASRGNVIVRGWGAVRLLRAIPHVLRVRVCAPMEERVAEMVGRLGVTRRAARREIERSDATHSSLFERFFGDDWRRSADYDLVLNTARLTPEQCADMVVDLVARGVFDETDESRRKLADRVMEARIASYLAHDTATRPVARNVYVSVSDGAVTLYGGVRRESAAREIADAVRSLAGTGAIRNEIHAIGPYANA